ncbi:DUF1254 domain-containing protein [Bradyrhizobium sp. UFLA05-153]
MKLASMLHAMAALMVTIGQAQAQSTSQGNVPVTVDNFARAETDMYFDLFTKRGGFGKFVHLRELPLENTGVRPNRDTLYSEGVFDLDAGPVTIAMPDAGRRFMSLMVIDQDHYAYETAYGAGSHTYSRQQIGTRYLFAGARILVDPNDPNDFKQVHALQDTIKITQPGGPGRLETPNWDQASQKKVRDALLVLSETLPDLRRAGGRKDQVDPVRHLIGTASGWGLNPDKDATYLNVTPSRNDGTGSYKLSVKDVPVDGFWSITVYDATGHFQKNAQNAYSLNNITARREPDGFVAVQFGGCDGKIPNCLPTMPGWNYMVRLYRPREEILNGTWNFPEAHSVN